MKDVEIALVLVTSVTSDISIMLTVEIDAELKISDVSSEEPVEDSLNTMVEVGRVSILVVESFTLIEVCVESLLLGENIVLFDALSVTSVIMEIVFSVIGELESSEDVDSVDNVLYVVVTLLEMSVLVLPLSFVVVDVE